MDLPGWLLKRAREMQAVRVVPILEPRAADLSALYLVEYADFMELHAVQEANEPSNGATIALSKRDAAIILGNLAGALVGRIRGLELSASGAESARG